MDLNYDALFKFSVLFMKINRSHPDIPRDRKWFFSFLIMHGAFIFMFLLLLYSMIFHDVKNNDFSKACCNGIFCVIGLIITFKYSMMLMKQHVLADLMKTMKEDYREAQSLALEDQVLLLSYAYEGRWVCRLWLVLGVLTASLFPLKSMLLMLLSAVKGDFQLIPVHDLTFPAVIEQRKEETVMFIAIYILNMWYAFYAACMYIALVPMGPIFLTHACGQLELLKRRLHEVFQDENDENYNAEEAYEKLKRIIIKLQTLYRFVQQIEDVFRLIYEFSLKGSAVTLPITLYQVLETLKMGEFSLEFSSFIFGCIALIGCPCYYSDLLYETGESYRQAIYENGWEKHWDRRARSTLRVMLVRCARPVAVRSMFRTIRLDSLTEVSQQAYALFNLLNTVT